MKIMSEKKENRELTSQERLEKKKKSKKKKTALIVTLSIVGTVLIVVVLIVLGARKAMDSLMKGTVTLGRPERGELLSDITITGTVESERTVHYNAPDAILIDMIKPVGSYVKKGEKILEFNKESFNEALRLAELKNESGVSSYEGSLAKNEEVEKKLADAKARYWKYTKLVNEQQAVVDQLEKDITDGNAYWSAALNTQVGLTTKELEDYQHNNKDKYAELTSLGYTPTVEDEKWLKEYEEFIYKKQQELTNLNNQIKEMSTSAAAYDNQKKINEANTLLAEYKSEKAAAESEMKSYQASVPSEYDIEGLEINNEITQIQNKSYYDSLIEYFDGLVAPFDGVVTASGYTRDDTTSMGAPLVTFSSLDDLHVTLGVNKTDLESIKEGQTAKIKILGNMYEGKVTTINRMVMQNGNSSQVMVTVSIDDPDDNMYIGIDAKCTINLASLDDCLKVPVESVNIDNKGEFVYTVDPSTMVVGKKYVETGVSSDFYIEVVSGLDENDLIVSSYTGTITEGMPAMVSPESVSYLSGAEN